MTQHDHIHRSGLLRDLTATARDLGPSDGPLLDVGCGERPYASLFRMAQVAVDYTNGDADPHVLASAEKLPLATAAMGVVLSTQYLEHSLDPRTTLDEMRRVLRPGGLLLLSTHGVFPHHGHPFDFWRWTEEGLRRQVTASGFAVTRTHRQGGLASAGLLLATYPLGFERSGATRRAVAGGLTAVVNTVAAAADRLVDRVSDHHYAAISYLIEARAT